MDPTAAQLRDERRRRRRSSRKRYGQVPTGVPAIVGDDGPARSRPARQTDYEKALLLQSFFRDRGEFTYDLDAGYGYGYHAMAAFLEAAPRLLPALRRHDGHDGPRPSASRRGSSSASSPADKSDRRRHYVFTSHDVHAWPELYFGGVGWVRFEPTPGIGRRRSRPTPHTVPRPTRRPLSRRPSRSTDPRPDDADRRLDHRHGSADGS